MYDLYPEWGPAKHRTEEATLAATNTPALQAALDRRDNGAPRPDDN